MLPVVKFVNGREEVLVPESFTADVAAVGVCKRLQVWHNSAPVLCLSVFGQAVDSNQSLFRLTESDSLLDYIMSR